ncbi:MAG TPA: hypothetical protein VHC90_07285, partial [Bryobacteraceae bacterium]|nr:hypothetical protein [Bryobacteraceae bacterium]
MMKTARLEGVAGVLVSEAPEGVLFGRLARQSPYDPLLEQLRTAGPGKFLKFDSLRARPSVAARAKKLGIKVLFGEQGETLWVTLARAEMHAEGSVDQPKQKTNAELVLEAIAAKR